MTAASRQAVTGGSDAVAVLLDLDDTLVVDDPVVIGSLYEVCASVPRPVTPEELLREVWIHAHATDGASGWRPPAAGVSPVDRMLCAGGEHSSVEGVWRPALGAVGLTEPGLAERLDATFRRLTLSRYRLHDGALPALEALSARYAVGVATNGATELQLYKVRRLGLEPYLSTMCISEQVGVAKPEPDLLLRACDDLGVPPEHSVYVGNDQHVDGTAARRAGLSFVHLDPAGGQGKRTAIGSLDALVALLCP